MAIIPTVGKRILVQYRPNGLDKGYAVITAVTHPASATEPYWEFDFQTELKEGSARLQVGDTTAVLIGERRERVDIDPIPF